jgi:hypothetical protein
MSSATEEAELAVLKADLRTVRDAIEFYTADHLGRRPNIKESGGADGDPDHFIERLVGKTDVDGKRNPSGQYGPYLNEFPRNRFIEKESDQARLRIDGDPPGKDTRGWHFDSTTGRFSADSDGHGSL